MPPTNDGLLPVNRPLCPDCLVTLPWDDGFTCPCCGRYWPHPVASSSSHSPGKATAIGGNCKHLTRAAAEDR